MSVLLKWGSEKPFEIRKNIRNLFLVYSIVPNAVKMSISLIKSLICIKAYFLLIKCFY